MMKRNVEIYIRNCLEDDVVHWLSAVLGELQFIDDVEDGPRIYHAISEGKTTAISIQQINSQAEKYISVYISATSLNWETDLSFARAAYQQLSKEVRCSLGNESNDVLNPFKYLQIDASGEKIINWEKN